MSHGLVEDLELDGLTVHMRRWEPDEPRADAVPLLLVHGLGANTVSWMPVGQPLADRRGATVTAIDLAGFGYTRSVGTDATLNRNGLLVVATLERLGPAVVVGNSMGGALTVKVTARRPDLVSAMVLVNPAIRPSGLHSPQVRNSVFMAPMLVGRLGARLMTNRARQLGAEGLVDGTLAIVCEAPSALDPVLRDDLVKIARERMEYPEAARAYADAAASLFWYMSRNLDRDLAVALRARPGLLVFGDQDRLVHVSSAHALALRHPAIDLELLEGVGHAPQLDAPELFVDVVDDWLTSLFGR